jgi:hypothetical protein
MPDRKTPKPDAPEPHSVEVLEYDVSVDHLATDIVNSTPARIAHWATIVVFIVPIVVEDALFFWKPPPPAWMGLSMRAAFWLFDRIDHWDERRAIK